MARVDKLGLPLSVISVSWSFGLRLRTARCSPRDGSERDCLVAVADPFCQRLHGGGLGALEIRLVLVDAAPRHAGSAHLDRDAAGDQGLQHLGSEEHTSE